MDDPHPSAVGTSAQAYGASNHSKKQFNGRQAGGGFGDNRGNDLITGQAQGRNRSQVHNRAIIMNDDDRPSSSSKRDFAHMGDDGDYGEARRYHRNQHQHEFDRAMKIRHDNMRDDGEQIILQQPYHSHASQQLTAGSRLYGNAHQPLKKGPSDGANGGFDEGRTIQQLQLQPKAFARQPQYPAHVASHSGGNRSRQTRHQDQRASRLTGASEEYIFSDDETESLEARPKYVNGNSTLPQGKERNIAMPQRKLARDEQTGELHEIFVQPEGMHNSMGMPQGKSSHQGVPMGSQTYIAPGYIGTRGDVEPGYRQ